jgi:hypothetical protein
MLVMGALGCGTKELVKLLFELVSSDPVVVNFATVKTRDICGE